MTLSVQADPVANALNVRSLSDSGQGAKHFYVRGTGYNNSANRIVRLNDTDHVNTSGRGVYLTVFDASWTRTHNARYDIYGDDQKRTDLANYLNGLNDTDIFIITSYDAIRSNANLDAAMEALGSWHWDERIGSPVRRPYACAGIKQLGIVQEQLWDDGASDPYAEFEWTVEDLDTIGSTGYGPMLRSNIMERSYSGTGYGFYTYMSWTTYESLGVKDQEYIRLTCEIKVDATRAAANGYCRIYMYDRSPGDGWVRATSYGTKETDWVKVELLFKRDDAASAAASSDGLPSNQVGSTVYHYPSSIDDGTSYIRNVQIQRCGFSPNNATKTAKMSKQVLTAPNIIEVTDAGPIRISNKTFESNEFKESL
jgi:hypothetical protein